MIVKRKRKRKKYPGSSYISSPQAGRAVRVTYHVCTAVVSRKNEAPGYGMDPNTRPSHGKGEAEKKPAAHKQYTPPTHNHQENKIRLKNKRDFWTNLTANGWMDGEAGGTSPCPFFVPLLVPALASFFFFFFSLPLSSAFIHSIQGLFPSLFPSLSLPPTFRSIYFPDIGMLAREPSTSNSKNMHRLDTSHA